MKLNPMTRAAAGALAALTIGAAAYSIGHNSGYSTGYNSGHNSSYSTGYDDGAIYTIENTRVFNDCDESGKVYICVDFPDGTALEQFGIELEKLPAHW